MWILGCFLWNRMIPNNERRMEKRERPVPAHDEFQRLKFGIYIHHEA